MPDGVSDSGDVSAANFSDTGQTVLTGYVQTYSTGAGDEGVSAGTDGSASGSPLFSTGINKTVLSAGTTFEEEPSDPRVFQASASSGGITGQISASPPTPAPVFTTQVVNAEIRNTVVQPIEPCRSIPYLKLVFLPVDTDVRFRRDLRREASVPVPKKLQMTVDEFKAIFDGHVHIKDTKYLLRWKQILPVVIEPQDSNSVDYKSVDIYDLRTSILLNDPLLVDRLNFSQLPLVQVTKAEDIQGGTLDPGIENFELYLDDVIFADVDQATGKLIAKDVVEAGIFTG